MLRLVSVGRLGNEKGYVYALEVVAQLVATGNQKLRYTIVGTGLEREALKEAVKRLGLAEYVTFAGQQDKRGVIAELQRADVLLLPSVTTPTWAETQACVVQEAMPMKLLVVTKIAGGVPTSIPSVMKRFSVPIRNAPALARVIRCIAALPEEEFAPFGAIGREFVIAKYDIRSINRELLRRALHDQSLQADTIAG